MIVKNLSYWAGMNFEVEVGQDVELDDATAIARCEAGLASASPQALAAARKRLAGTGGNEGESDENS